MGEREGVLPPRREPSVPRAPGRTQVTPQPREKACLGTGGWQGLGAGWVLWRQAPCRARWPF